MQSISVERQPGPLQGLVDGRHRADAHLLGVRPRPRPSRVIRAIGLRPSSLAFSSDITSSGRRADVDRRAVARRDRAARRVERRRQRPEGLERGVAADALVARSAGPCGPRRRGPRSGRSRRWNSPLSVAAAASWWLRRANSSCFLRGIRYLAARYSAVRPMFMIASLCRRNSAGVGVVVLAHRHVVHVLDAAGDLHVLAARRRCSSRRR